MLNHIDLLAIYSMNRIEFMIVGNWFASETSSLAAVQTAASELNQSFSNRELAP